MMSALQTVPVTPGWRPAPQPGDVLVSRRTARTDAYAIGLVPAPAQVIGLTYDDAMMRACALARGLAVDGWYTGDHAHYLRIAAYRT